MNKEEASLLRSYANGPRIWDASAILPGVWALAGKGLIEPVGDERAGVYQLTEAGREALEESEGPATSTRPAK